MGIVIGFLATLLGALFGASFGSWCSIEYGGWIGSSAGLLIGLIGSQYAWSRFHARRRAVRLRIELRSGDVPGKRAA
jgi:hypothetical protein